MHKENIKKLAGINITKPNKEKIKKEFIKVIASTRIKIAICCMLILMISINTQQIINGIVYSEMLGKNEMAEVQTSIAAIVGDFTSCENLIDAEQDGIFEKFKQYSTLSYVRVRIVNEQYVIVSDTYSSDYRKNIISNDVVNVFSKGKNYSNYNSKNGTIEIIVPIYNNQSRIIGVCIVDKDLSKVKNICNESKNVTNIYELGIIVIAACIIYFIVNLLFRRYKKAYKILKDVADGHIDMRIPEKGSIELRQIAKKFNIILDKALSLDESRQQFVSNVSHELKTPITSIKVLADSLNMQEDVPVELYKEFMQDIANEIDRESKIIEDLLSLVRMDKTAASINISSVNINELIEIVLKRLKPLAEKKNIEILFESFRPVVAEIDEVKITQVISNLVENAIKYNENNGWVHVSLNADYQNMYIRVEDSGIGIPKESQDYVFDRFYRVDKARSRETGGTGLGLAIVKSIILLHHGTIKLYSEEGNGTTFTIRMPLNYVE